MHMDQKSWLRAIAKGMHCQGFPDVARAVCDVIEGNDVEYALSFIDANHDGCYIAVTYVLSLSDDDK